MNRKILTKEDLLLLNGSLIYIFKEDYEGAISTFEHNKQVAIVHVEDDRVYLLNNRYSGSIPDEFNFESSPFKRSWCYDGEILCMEMTGSEANMYIEKIKVYNSLNDGDRIYHNGKLGDVRTLMAHGKTFKGESVIILDDDFFILEEETVKSFKNITEDPLLDKKDKELFINNLGNYQNVARFFPKYFYKKIPVSIGIGSRLNIDINDERLSNYFGNISNIPQSIIQSVRDIDSNKINEYYDERFFMDKNLLEIIKSIDSTVHTFFTDNSSVNNTKMNFISLDLKEKTVKFIAKGKDIVLTEDFHTDKNFQTVKPHKFFNAALKEIMSEYDIKKFVDTLLAYKDPYIIKYYKGKKIAENYSKLNTREWSTTSCMDRKAENFFEMYTDRRFRLGVIFCGKEQVGRFLEVTADDGFVYNDRLYYKDENTLAWYNNWVNSKGLTRKADNSYSSKKAFFNATKGRFNKEVTVSLAKDLGKLKIYPYLDTLTFGNKNKLTNFETRETTYTFTVTNGKCSRNNMVLDVVTGEYIHNNFAVRIDFGKDAGKSTTVEHLIYSAENGGHCLK